MIRNNMKRFDGINVIPLIDVMLVLLAVILMTASFIVKDSLQIDLPETVNTQAYKTENNVKPLQLHIDRNNQIYINEQPHSLTEFQSFLTGLNKQQEIVLQVDKKTEFGTFVKLVDSLKGQQLNNLTILTKSEDQ